MFRGRVLDKKGNPVPDAAVEPIGYRKGDTGRFGQLDGFDPLAVTNSKGEFRLGIAEKGAEIYLRVEARYLARRSFAQLAADRTHDLTLDSGVTVTGRLVKGNHQLPGGAVGLVQQDRGVERFTGEYRAAADDKGVFRIPNVPPDEAMYVYGLMDSLKSNGALPTKPCRTGKTGTELDLGDLAVGPGHRLSGRLVLGDGKPVPAGTRVIVSRQEAWDSQHVVVGKDGSFAFEGLPAEQYSMSANVRGYHASPKNASFDLLNPWGLLGKVDRDITGLRLLYEKGEEAPRQGEWTKEVAAEYDRRRNGPLRGAPDDAGP